METGMTNPGGASELARRNAAGMKGWMKFMGIMNIIGGALNCLSIVGALWGWIPIWLGIILMGAGSRADDFARQGDTVALEALTGKLKTYFTISGIMLIVSIVMGLLAGIAWIVLIAAGVLSSGGLGEIFNRF